VSAVLCTVGIFLPKTSLCTQCPECGFKLFVDDMGVNHRRGEVRMPQRLLDQPDVFGLAVEASGERMPKGVRPDFVRVRDARLLRVALNRAVN